MRYGTALRYRVFVRDWWLPDPTQPDGRKLGPGPSRTIARSCTVEEAQAIAREYNATHKPGKYSRKAEWGEE